MFSSSWFRPQPVAPLPRTRLPSPRFTLGRVAALLLTLPVALPPAAVGAQEAASEETPEIVEVPSPDLGAQVLGPRARQQMQEIQRSPVFHGFTFNDRVKESGITFTHRIVDDAGKHYKPVHYDHGNGVAVADVDGDGWLDLYFTTQIGANELWHNQGNGTFENWTARAGVGLEDKISVTASFGDIDNDGDPDLYVSTVNQGNHLFENRGDGRFRDVSEAAGVDHVGHSSGIVFFDYNRDGRLDFFLTNVGVYTLDEKGRGGAWVGRRDAFAGQLHPDRTETSILFENQGGRRFTDVSKERGLVDGGWTGDAAFTLLDDDLWPDLYVLNMQGDDHYYENRGGKRFVDRTEQLFPQTPWGSMGVEFFDFDNDGDQDLMLTDMHSDMSKDIGPRFERLKSDMQWPDDFLQGGENNIFGNAFYRNQGNGRFEEVSDQIHAENYWPWGISVGDLNADGWEDVFVASSMNYPFRYGINTVLLNERGREFQHAEFVLGIEPRREHRLKVPWFELDCGTAEQPGPDRDHEHCEGRNGEVIVYANLGTRSSVFFDLDRDGDLDIVTNDFNSEPMVLVSNLAQQKEIRWLEIDLTGTRSNRDGLGARVEVQAGGQVQTRIHDGKSGYLSQSSKPLYFGLGDAEKVDRIEVSWPSGETQTLTDVEPDQRLEITEPEPEGEAPEEGGSE